MSKTTSYKSRANTTQMEYQLECHLALGANWWKPSYDLDTYLNRGTLNDYIRHFCN